MLAHVAADHPGIRVIAAAGGKADDKTYRFAFIKVRLRESAMDHAGERADEY